MQTAGVNMYGSKTAVRINNSAATAAVLGFVLLASILLPLPDTHGHILELPSVCLFYDLTGLPCPGCGLTRSFVCFAHGQFARAFRWNLLGPPLWLIFVFFFVRAVATLVGKRRVLPFSQSTIKWSSWVAAAVFSAFGLGRIVLLTIEHRKF